MKKRILLFATVLLLSLIPAYAVFKEKNLNQTLKVLHYELANSYDDIVRGTRGASQRESEQQKVLVNLMKNCNELSLMLYSQPQDFTFDLTYALNEVTKQYLSFDANRMPYDQIVESMKIELERYDKLAQTLRNMPPVIKDGGKEPQVEIVLDSLTVATDTLLSTPSFIEQEGRMDAETAAIRDSCLFYAEQIVQMYWEGIHRIEEDNSYYVETDKHLKEAYDYAQDRYRHVQKKIFIDGQTGYFRILQHPQRYVFRARRDCREKYGTESFKSGIVSEWRGPIVIGLSVIVFFYIILAVVLSNLIVRITMRKVKYFQSEYFQQHRMMFINLFGVIIFSLTIMIANFTMGGNGFYRMASGMLAEYAWLLAALFLSMLIRMDSGQSRHALAGYMPVIILALVIITFRIIFIPNSLINVVFPPLLLVFTLWQLVVNLRRHEKVPQADRVNMWISLAVFAVATLIGWAGYVMMALLVIIWWTFQLTVVQSITAVSDLLTRYYDTHLSRRLSSYRKRHPNLPLHGKKGAYIEVSWGYDLLKKVLVPVASVWSLPVCIFMAGKVFDLSGVCMEYFYKPFLNVEGVIHLSLFKIVVVVSLFFLFRYLEYALKAFYRVLKTRSVMRKLGDGIIFKESDINFNLIDNLISLCCWGIFAVISFVMLKIPTSALTIITTGLATGIGFALKDVLNNFFYGIQLMSGRLRVGDVVECDGVRGTVDSLSYQSTQILANDGSIIAFSNSTLFSKNFKNLTRNHQYELLQIPVGVKYGTDVEEVRRIIIDALKVLQVKDKYGREVVDPKRGVTVKFAGFGDNSVDLTVSQFTTVDTHYTYAAQAREIIYNALNENGIEIPFPQRDVYIKETPQ